MSGSNNVSQDKAQYSIPSIVKKLGVLTATEPQSVIPEYERYLRRSRKLRRSIDPAVHMRLLFYCIEACDYLGLESNIDSYIVQCSKLYVYLKRAEDKAYFLQCMGVYYHYAGMIPEALEYLHKAVHLAEETHLNDVYIKQALNLLGAIYFEKGSYSVALAYHRRRSRVIAKTPGTPGLSQLYCGMAKVFAAVDFKAEARSNFQKSLESARARRKPVLLAQILADYANFCVSVGKIEEAATAVAESQSLAHLYNLQYLSAPHSLLHVRICIESGAYGSGRQRIERLLILISESWRNTGLKIACLEARGMILIRQGELADAKLMFFRMAQCASALGARRQLCTAFRQLSHIEERGGAFVSALRYYKIASRLSASLIDIRTLREIDELCKQGYGSNAVDNVYRILLESGKNNRGVQPIRFSQGKGSVGSTHNPMYQIESVAEQRSERGKLSALAQNLRVVTKYKTQIKDKRAVRLADNFSQKLLDRAPNLTPTEINICLMIATGLRSKEIAAQLYNSVETVHTHRKNIRKKLRLAARENLASYLAQF